MAAGEDDKATDPSVLAEAVWTAGTTARPRHRYAVRWDLGRRLLDRLPVPLVDTALQLALGGRINAKKSELRQEAADTLNAAAAEVRP